MANSVLSYPMERLPTTTNSVTSCPVERLFNDKPGSINDIETGQSHPKEGSSMTAGRLCLPCGLIFCILGTILLFTALFVGGGFLIGALLKPDFTFQVDSLGVTISRSSGNSSNTSNQLVEASLNLTLTVKTKEEKLFEKLKVRAEYDHELLASKELEPFHVESREQKTMRFVMGTSTRLNDKVADSIISRLSSGRELEVTVVVRGQYWRLQNVDDDKDEMKLRCKGVKVTLLAANNIWTGSTVGGPLSCKFRQWSLI